MRVRVVSYLRVTACVHKYSRVTACVCEYSRVFARACMRVFVFVCVCVCVCAIQNKSLQASYVYKIKQRFTKQTFTGTLCL